VEATKRRFLEKQVCSLYFTIKRKYTMGNSFLSFIILALAFFIWSLAVILILSFASLLKIRAITNFFKIFFSWISAAELLKLFQIRNYLVILLLVMEVLLLIVSLILMNK
jgi:hypothetical protein